MAISCKICQTELDALVSGRCRKCRQLICPACIGAGEVDSPEGILCSVCVTLEPLSMSEEENPLPTAEETSDVSGADAQEALAPEGASKVSLRSLRIWIGLGGLLGLLFIVIVNVPGIQAYYYAGKLRGKNLKMARQAADQLALIGSRRALSLLIKVSQEDDDNARLIAIEAMGRFADPRAGKALRALQAQKLSADLRRTVEEALIRHAARRDKMAAESGK